MYHKIKVTYSWGFFLNVCIMWEQALSRMQHPDIYLNNKNKIYIIKWLYTALVHVMNLRLMK